MKQCVNLLKNMLRNKSEIFDNFFTVSETREQRDEASYIIVLLMV